MTLWACVLIPIAAAVVVAYGGRRTAAIAAAALVATAALGAWLGSVEAASSVSWGPRMELTIAASGFARVMIVLVPTIALAIVVYAAATERTRRASLIALLTAFVGAMELLVLADDLLTLLIAWELVGAFSWILIAHDWKVASNVQMASHAFITTRLGDLGLYLAAGIAFASTGSFTFSDIPNSDATHLQVIAGGILLAAAAKSAQLPFSPWLFSAMAGPTPVSALLHSSTMVASGAYALVRLGPHLSSVEWFSPAVVAIGLSSALAGGIVAAVHRHPKRLLAASTTSQYGLMFVAVGAGSFVAAGAHLVTHAAFKSLLFLTAGTAMHAGKSEDVGDMRLGRRLPLIAAFAAIGALALAAFPPLGGAWSKEQITGAAFESSPLLGTAVLVGALVGAFYALRYWLLVFGFGHGRSKDTIPAPVLVSTGSLALLSLLLGLLWVPEVNEAAAGLVTGEVVPTHALELTMGLASLAIAAAFAVMLQRRARLASSLLPPMLSTAATEWFWIAAAARRMGVDPVLATARFLAAFDDHVIDAGIRASVRIAGAFSRFLRRRSELSIDAMVNAVGGGTLLMASGTRVADEYGVDRSVERVAQGLGRAGDALQRSQTGLSHHYYLIVAAGVAAVVTALALGAS